jgi:hypothetical protein
MLARKDAAAASTSVLAFWSSSFLMPTTVAGVPHQAATTVADASDVACEHDGAIGGDADAAEIEASQVAASRAVGHGDRGHGVGVAKVHTA